MKLLMKELLTKFRNGTISPDELLELRRISTDMSDEEIGQILASDWDDNGWISEPVSEETKEKIRASIMELKMEGKKSRFRYNMRMVAACIATFIVVAAGFFIYNRIAADKEYLITVMTEPEEGASVSLPDGSTVKLNGQSSLTYDPRFFISANRSISFSGEGYFKIYHDSDKPFTILSDNLEITVLGTEFNFSTDVGNDCAMLFLINGRVEMHSEITDRKIEVEPGQKALFHKKTGEFTVTKPDKIENLTAWYTGEIRFDNEPLDKVVEYLESHYDCRLQIASLPSSISRDNVSSLYFTGTLPTGNLSLALKAIETVYGIRFTASRRW